MPVPARQDIHQLAQVEPFHVAAFVHDLQDELSPPSVKQQRSYATGLSKRDPPLRRLVRFQGTVQIFIF